MDQVDVAVVGAGIVGLSVAAHAAREGRSLLLLERHGSFGRETSSRNSEVIHASIYYPRNSLKGRLCLEGNERMYALCKEFGIPHRNTRKLIVAWTKEQESRLPALLKTAQDNGAVGVRLVGADEVRPLEPAVEARAAMLCPTSGIVDSHALMAHFQAQARSRGAEVAYNAEVVGIERVPGGFRVSVREAEGGSYAFETRVVVNCAGLGSGRVAALAGIDAGAARYRIHFRKGMYFRVMRNLHRMPQMLVYPVPPEDSTVGIHTTTDLAGGQRLGPHDEWVTEEEYSVDPSLLDLFYDAAKPFLPGLRREDLQPDTAGIHPKSYGPGEPSQDFIIRHEADRGLPGLIDLIGIESPGLTSSPAIGPHVARMVDEALS